MTGPNNRQRYLREIAATGLPIVELRTMAELMRAYQAWGLER